ncbi:13S globulin seed storage protein 2-like [Chenopodium quinoa]|uniref:13S globulin seed storage protein 2-like n=1 Tax=Chenopodium quinoa TaxID=63459 RepID=UPI000B76CE93|nr:13S globulin seed storage protein 2-like [Chenopodium quinoa]
MSRVFLLPLALTLLILSPTSLAQLGFQLGQSPFLPSGQSSPQHSRLQRGQQALNDCQINQLSANEPSIRIQAEAGITEVWDPKEQQEFQCAGVTVIRREIEPKGLLLPHYNNAPSISYVIRGRGLLGLSSLGCADTYESGSPEFFSEESRRSERFEESRRSERGSEEMRDQHQKVRRFHKGHVIGLPAGVSKWVYNDGEDRLTIVTLYDTNNFQNQLDDNLRSFFLAGNPQGRGGDQSGRQHESSRRHTRGGQEEMGQNILSGFDKQLLADAFEVESDTISKIQGENDDRGAIIRVESGELEMLIPEWDQEEQRSERHHRGGGSERSEEEERSERHHRGGRGRQSESSRPHNGIEQTLCSARLSVNIDNPERADVFNPQGGRLTNINSNKLPILNYLRLSAEKVNLYKNAIMTPNWKINAHSIVYFTKGSGRVQIANHEGELVFDDMVQEGQLVVVPQNFVVLKRAGQDGLEWVALLTNDNAMSSPLAGRISAIRGMPIEVVMNSYKLSREEAQRLKYGRQELSVFSPSKRSERRGDEYAIV